MKLDRNTNPDGRGKYALINLRTNQVQWGGPGGEQFFVLKFKDKFTAPALHAYARAVHDAAYRARTEGRNDEADSLYEYAHEIEREADAAEKVGTKIPD